jgi:putative transposase
MTGRAVRVDVRMMIATWPVPARRGAVTAFCREHQISRSTFYAVRAQVGAVGVVAAVAPPARRVRPDLATLPVVEAAAVRVRKELADAGWDHGPLSVAQEMGVQGLPVPSRATLARIFVRAGMVTPAPRKRPRSSWRRFTFGYVHQCWQLDATEWRLADGSVAMVFQMLDDHSRFIVGSLVDTGETSAGAVAVLTRAISAHQVPQLLLTDNGLAMNPHRRGKVSQLAAEAQRLGITAITGRPYHPQTTGKNERVHSTLKKWLRRRPLPVSNAELTGWLGEFDQRYNYRRGHQGLDGRTPATVLAGDTRAVPPEPPQPVTPPPRRPCGQPRKAHDVRRIRVTDKGAVRVNGAFIGLGVEHGGSDILAVIEDHQVAVFDADGTLLRSVDLSDAKTYYPTGRNRGGPPRPRYRRLITTTKLSGITETETSGPN